MEPNRKVRKQGLEHFIKFVRELPCPSPQAMFQALHELGYRGQEHARRALCLMAYRHVRRVKRIYVDGVDRAELPRKSNFLFVGPTGSGKTFLVESLFGKILKLPTALVDITTYSETGYVGQDPSTILTRLLHTADENPLLASIGIVCLDEFDKIASGQNNAIFAGAGTTKDVTGLGVQRELLKMLEASEVVVPLELTHSSYGEHVANFQAYGFLPELLARFSRFVPFEALDEGTLMDILKTSVVDRLTREFEDEGFALIIEEDVMKRIVSESLRRETGARGLASVLTRHIEDAAFESFAEASGGEI